MASEKILVIEDEEATRFLCEALLQQEGFEVVLAADAAAGSMAMLQGKFDLVLLDLNLPDGDGLEVAKKIKAWPDSPPIIIMTARQRPEERLEGFESGAVDYLVKPFHPGELLHRVKNVIAGSRTHRPSTKREEKSLFRFGHWQLDLDSRSFSCLEDERQVELTRGEFDLLAALAQREGRVADRYSLLDIVTRGESEGHPRTVDVLVSRVRRKINKQADNPVKIVAVPGIGYRLEEIAK